MSLISIDECFSSPQRPGVKSDRLTVKVKSQGGSLTVADLKKAIVRKGYPSLSDEARITLIIPTGQGTLLKDHTMASSLPLNPTILALVSSTPNETLRLSTQTLPPILYVYTTSALRAYFKMPSYIPFPHAGIWTGIHLAWAMSLDELVFHFSQLGFHQQVVWREARRFDDHLAFASGPFASVDRDHKGHLAPQLMFRLWDAAGFNKVTTQQRALNGARSEFEVYSASCFSVDSVSSVATLRCASPSLARPAIPSVVMASPSEHSSAYDDAFYQQYLVPAHGAARTVSSSSDGSRSCASSETDGMDWVLDPQRAAERRRAPTFATSSKVSQLIKRVNELTNDRDRALSEAKKLREALTTGDEAATAALAMLGSQAEHYEAERNQLGVQLEGLTKVNVALKEEVQAEVRTVEALFEKLQTSVGVEEGVKEKVREIQENLAGVVTCSICCERYGSLSDNQRRRPIHLSCGHIFCASCLDADWSERERSGISNPSRCFNRCQNFDPSRLAEIYLLEDVKEVLDRLARC